VCLPLGDGVAKSRKRKGWTVCGCHSSGMYCETSVCRENGGNREGLGYRNQSISGDRFKLYILRVPSNVDMNAVMRRIDLFCKLAGPLFVSVLTIPSASFAAIFLAASNILSLPFEYSFILVVHKHFPDLAHKPAPPERIRQPLLRHFLQWPQRTLSSWKIYYRSPLFSASLSLCILYFTVLSFGGIPIFKPC